jgi:AcrR family transcriptional regulator
MNSYSSGKLMSKEDPVQQQLIAARRNQILAAAVQAFAEKGFHRATIRDVAKIAGIADGTIYNYFGSKQELLLGILDQLNESDNRAEAFARSQDMDLREFMKLYLQHRLEAVSAHGLAVLRILFSELLINDELRELYFQRTMLPTMMLGETYFEQRIAEGKLQAKDAATAMRYVASTFVGILLMRLLGDPKMESDWKALAQNATDMILDGLEAKDDSTTDNRKS